MNTGKKFDGNKTRYDLLPPKALDEFAKVLTFGASKYGPENWKQLDDLTNRYFAAAQRHLWAFKRGESHDDESGFHHLAHALCCIAFMLEDEFDKLEDPIVSIDDMIEASNKIKGNVIERRYLCQNCGARSVTIGPRHYCLSCGSDKIAEEYNA